MKVLITGGTGTISSGLVNECVNRGYEVYAITRGKKTYRNIKGVNYLYADVFNTDEVKKVLNNMYFDVIVECLAYNLEQLKISLENFSKHCAHYFFVSTICVFFGNKNLVVKESDKMTGTEWSYSKNKILCEEYLNECAKKTGMKYTIVRPAVTYGDYRVPYPIATREPVWSFFDRIVEDKPMISCANVQFSVTHILDFSKAVVSLFHNKKAYNEDFNIASEKSVIYWDDVIFEASKILVVTPKIVHVPLECYKLIWPEVYDELKYNKSESMIVDSSKLSNAIGGFDITFSIKDGMEKLINTSKQEFIINNLKNDDKWNLKIDLILFYIYKNKCISNDEMNIVNKYIASFTIHKRKMLVRELRKTIFKNRIKKVLKSLK